MMKGLPLCPNKDLIVYHIMLLFDINIVVLCYIKSLSCKLQVNTNNILLQQYVIKKTKLLIANKYEMK